MSSMLDGYTHVAKEIIVSIAAHATETLFDAI
jgi:hypothetical protein